MQCSSPSKLSFGDWWDRGRDYLQRENYDAHDTQDFGVVGAFSSTDELEDHGTERAGCGDES